MKTVKVHEAKTNLSKLIALVEAGEEVIIARGDKPIVKLIKVDSSQKTPRKPGPWNGRLKPIPDAFFFDPLPEDELQAWEGKYSFEPEVKTKEPGFAEHSQRDLKKD